MNTIDAEKHSALSSEAHRRIACAAAMDESVSTRANGDAAAILAGARAFLWIASGICRRASARLIADLNHDYGTATVLSAAIAMCRELPPGARTWLPYACKQRAGDGATLRLDPVLGHWASQIDSSLVVKP